MIQHDRGHSQTRAVTLRSLCILSMFVLISVMPLFFIDAGATTGSRQSFSVTIDHVPALKQDQSYTFNASVQGASPDLIIGLTFKWDFGDQYSNSSNPKLLTTTGLTTATHVFTQVGTYTVGLTVSDGQGDQSTASAPVSVDNVVPTPDISIERRSTFEDEPITFIASGQLDTPSDIPTLLFSWSLDKEQPSAYSSKGTIERTYPQAGTHTVTLSVKDAHGAIGAVSKVFTVDDQPPLAVGTYTGSLFANRYILFNASSSLDTPSDMATLRYSWDFGDGSNATGVNAEHVFMTSGKHNVWLTVTDNDGLSSKQLLVVSIKNLAPIPRFVVVQKGGSDFVTLDATDTTDTPDDIGGLHYSWAVDGVGVGNGKILAYRFDSLGSHTVTLMVTDPEGALSEQNITVVVTNHAPSISLAPVTDVIEDQTVHLVASSISDPEGSPVYVDWACDGCPLMDPTLIPLNGTQENFDHVYTDSKLHWVRVSVSDDRGATAFAQIEIKAIDPTPQPVLKVDNLGVAGQAMHFDASSSKDNPSDLSSLVYNWSFGDGSIQSGISVDHTFTKPGEYTVNLTVRDDEGALGRAQHVVAIIAQDLWQRYSGKVLTVDFTVKDDLDGKPGIDPGEQIELYGTVGVVSDWIGPDILHMFNTIVTAEIVGSNRTLQTTAASDGTFMIVLSAPTNSGHFTLKVMATMSPLSAEATSQHKVNQEPTASSPVSTPLVVGTISATVGLIAVGTIAGTDLGRYKFFTLMIPLFTRLRKPKVLDHFERGRIYEHIRKTPGDTYSSIRKALDIQNGALAHHLRVLEFHEYIVSRRDGMYKRFYPKGMKIPEGKHRSIQEQMLEMIMANPKITQTQMAERLGIDRSTVNYHVKILLAMGVIRSEKDGKTKYYYFVGVRESLPFEG